MIEILAHERAEDLISNTAAYLETRESEHNLPLGLMYGLAGNPQRYGVEPPVMLSVMDRGRAVGMAILTHGRKLILSRFKAKTEDAVIPLVRHLQMNEVPIPGVVGPEEEARVFSERWAGGCARQFSQPDHAHARLRNQRGRRRTAFRGGNAPGVNGRSRTHGAVDFRIFGADR